MTGFAALAIVRFSNGVEEVPLITPLNVTVPVAVNIFVTTWALLSKIVIGLFQVCAALETLLPNMVGPVTVSAPTAVVEPIAPLMLIAAFPVVPAFNVND